MTGEADRRPGIPRGERGAITVADRVVAKVASQVAREALSRLTKSADHVPPGRRTPGVTTSVRRAREQNAAGRDGESAASRQPACSIWRPSAYYSSSPICSTWRPAPCGAPPGARPAEKPGHGGGPKCRRSVRPFGAPRCRTVRPVRRKLHGRARDNAGQQDVTLLGSAGSSRERLFEFGSRMAPE